MAPKKTKRKSKALVTDRLDFISFLPIKHPIVFDGGSLTPHDDFAANYKLIDSCKHKDGFIYPPLTRQMRSSDQKERKEIPNTERPAFLYNIPPTHILAIDNPPIDDNFRENDGAFLMNLAAYLFGFRVHFHDWPFDGRVPIKSTHKIGVSPARRKDFFSSSYRIWKTWDQIQRKRFINILYMNSRSPSYEWDWERFTINYMVFDALYKSAENLISPKRIPHKERLTRMCKHFKLVVKNNELDQIYSLRNELFHESLWDGSRPGNGASDSAFIQPDNLRRLNQRLIVAVLGYKTEYIKSSWTTFGNFSF